MTSEEIDRVVFFTHADGVAAHLLAEGLDEAFGLAGIVLESRWPSRLKRRLRRILGDGLFRRALGLFLLLRTGGRLERRLRAVEDGLREAAERKLLEEAGGRKPAWPLGVPILRTGDVNGEASVGWCRKLRPDLFVLAAVPRIREPLLSLPRRGALNVHTSMLPDYRGPWPEFWQVLNGDLDSAGVTIHVVTERLDRGDIVQQQPTRASPDLDPYQLRSLNVSVARKILPEAVRAFSKGAAAPRPQGTPKTPPHRVRDRTQGRRVELLRKLGHLV